MKALGDHRLKDLTRRERSSSCAIRAAGGLSALKTLLRPADARTPSIAVLPFVNLSRDDENEYFADGLAEELLNVLGEDPRPARRIAHVGVLLQRRTRPRPPVAQKLNGDGARRRRRESGNRVRSRAADRGCHRLAPVVGDLRPRAHRHLRRAGRHRRAVVTVADRAGRSAHGGACARAATEVATLGATAATIRRPLGCTAARFYLGRHRSEDVPRALALLQQAVAIQPIYALGWTGLTRHTGTKGNTRTTRSRQAMRRHARRRSARSN